LIYSDASLTRIVFAFADDSTSVVSTSSIVIAVVIFVVSHAIYDYIIYRVKRTRLVRLLVFDCAATVNKLSAVVDQIDQTITSSSTDGDEFDRVRALHSGFPLSGPLVETKELIRNLDPIPASLLGRYFDRWTRLQEVERRYSKAYEKLVESVAWSKCGSASQNYYELVKVEYWSQVRAEMKLIRRLAIHLCHFSCELFTHIFSAAELGRNFALIQEHSNGRWKNWADFKQDDDRFKLLFSSSP
jgi:hypothetical protein